MPNYVRWREDGASYFFTVVTHRRRRLFDHADARRLLREALVTVRRRWPFDMFACVLLPDHVHCIWTLPAWVPHSFRRKGWGTDRVGQDVSSNRRSPTLRRKSEGWGTIRWANVKRLFTKAYLAGGGRALPVSSGRAKHREAGVWQARYWEHRIRDEVDWFRHRDYIHLNPVKHGLVSEPCDWPWSSFHRHVKLGWLDPNWPGASPVDLPAVAGE